MKRKIIELVICSLFIVVISCIVKIWYNSPDIKTRRTLNKIVTALAEKDVNQMFALFSGEIKETKPNLKNEINMLFSVCDGEYERVEFNSSGGEDVFEKGKGYSFVDAFYRIWFSGTEYCLFYTEYTKNSIKDKEGLQCLAIYPVSIRKTVIEELKEFGDLKQLQGVAFFSD